MKVRDLILQLQQTGMDNEVRIPNSSQYENADDYTDKLYLSFDDNNDIVIYEG